MFTFTRYHRSVIEDAREEEVGPDEMMSLGSFDFNFFGLCFLLFNDLLSKHLYFPKLFACQKQNNITKLSVLGFNLTTSGEGEQGYVLGEK